MTAALLWKHYEGYSTKNESRRARQLVIFSIATIGNYDYAVNWVFHQDGVLEVDAALSGIMLPKGVRETTANGHQRRARPVTSSPPTLSRPTISTFSASGSTSTSTGRRNVGP